VKQHRSTDDHRPPDLEWVVDDLMREALGIAHVIVATADGRTMVASPGLRVERVEQLASVTCGLTSLTTGAATLLDIGPVRQCVVEMARGYLIVMAVSDGSCLAVLAAKNVDDIPTDIGIIGYQMGRLVSRLGDLLTPALRAELTQTALG
jgi:predicted regulator of Ras-like GTPase activity (Roadblock/LC7/MglB family)